MRLIFIILLALLLWSASVSIQFKPPAMLPAQGPRSTCREATTHGQSLLQALNKGTIVGIHDNGKVLHIGIPGNWAAFSLEDQKNTIHQIHCYAKELQLELRYTQIPTLPQ